MPSKRLEVFKHKSSVEKSAEMAESNIVKFYEDRSIFITGATGFMGKVLVEKLLRTCPGINRLYLLMRPSKGKEVASRLQELISNEVTIGNVMWFDLESST